MSERKYRQRGYQDDGSRKRTPAVKRPVEPRDPRLPRDPRTPSLPGFRDVFRCARCGHREPPEAGPLDSCNQCGVPLHACIHCGSFDAGARYECRQSLTARISPKDTRNDCALFTPRVSVERETGSTPAAGGTNARKAFDDLFKL